VQDTFNLAADTLQLKQAQTIGTSQVQRGSFGAGEKSPNDIGRRLSTAHEQYSNSDSDVDAIPDEMGNETNDLKKS
jgi:hypothetical protein